MSEGEAASLALLQSILGVWLEENICITQEARRTS